MHKMVVRLALLALVLGVAGLWTFRLWPAPPRPAQVVPTIEIARGSAGGGDPSSN